jgi:hypothetical protein
VSNTPETDKEWGNWLHKLKIPIESFVDFARKLERERDEAIQQLEVGQALNSGLASKLEQYQRNLELIAEDCESWLNSESDEPSAEFVKLVAKHAREAIK